MSVGPAGWRSARVSSRCSGSGQWPVGDQRDGAAAVQEPAHRLPSADGLPEDHDLATSGIKINVHGFSDRD